jgi:MFS family permease
MWFDEIMDDCKQALITANKYKNVFVPIFLKLAFGIAILAYIVVSFVAGVFSHESIFERISSDPSAILQLLPPFIGNIIIIYLLALIGFSLLDVGSISMFKTALNDQKPKFQDFKEGVKNNLFKVILGKLFIHFLTIITLPLTVLLYLVYALIVGTLTAGWGVLFLGVFISIYLGTWVTIIVVEGDSPLKAIVKSIKLGRKYFKGLFVVILASTLISSYSTVLFGVLAAVLGGWFFAGVVATYFNMVVMLIYYRNKEGL